MILVVAVGLALSACGTTPLPSPPVASDVVLPPGAVERGTMRQPESSTEDDALIVPASVEVDVWFPNNYTTFASWYQRHLPPLGWTFRGQTATGALLFTTSQLDLVVSPYVVGSSEASSIDPQAVTANAEPPRFSVIEAVPPVGCPVFPPPAGLRLTFLNTGPSPC